MQAAWWQKAIFPGRDYDAHKIQYDATMTVLKVMRQRAELLGLNVNQAAEAKLLVEGRFRVIWDTPATLPQDQLNLLLEEQKNLLTPPDSSTSSDDNGKPPTQ
jgi:hypothetical protein